MHSPTIVVELCFERTVVTDPEAIARLIHAKARRVNRV